MLKNDAKQTFLFNQKNFLKYKNKTKHCVCVYWHFPICTWPSEEMVHRVFYTRKVIALIYQTKSDLRRKGDCGWPGFSNHLSKSEVNPSTAEPSSLTGFQAAGFPPILPLDVVTAPWSLPPSLRGHNNQGVVESKFKCKTRLWHYNTWPGIPITGGLRRNNFNTATMDE